MPKVPVIDTSISMDVSTGAAQSSGAPGAATSDAFARMGQGLAQIGSGLLRETVQVEAEQAATAQSYQDMYDSEDKAAELRRLYPTGFVTDERGQVVRNADNKERTITEEFREWSNARFQENQMKMPTRIAQNIYQKEAGSFLNQSLLKMHDHEMKLRVEHIEVTLAKTLNDRLNRLVSKPNLQDVYTATEEMLLTAKRAEKSVLGRDKYEQIEKKVKVEVPQSYFNGLKNQVLSVPKGDRVGRLQRVNDALAVLNGVDADSQARKEMGLKPISETMDPDQKARFIADFLALKNVAAKADKSDWTIKAENAKAQMRIATTQTGAGAQNDLGPLLSELFTEKVQQVRDGTTTTTQAAEELGPLSGEKAIFDLLRNENFRTANAQGKLAMMNEANNQLYKRFSDQLTGVMDWVEGGENSPEALKVTGAVFREKSLEKMQDILRQDTEQANKDFPQHMINYASEVRASTSQMGDALNNPRLFWAKGRASAWASRNKAMTIRASTYGLQVSRFKLLSDEESTGLGNWVNRSTNSDEVADGLYAMYRADPDNYPLAIDQMVREGKLDARWRLAVHMGSSKIKLMEIVQEIKTGDKMQDVLKGGRIAADGYSQSDFHKAVSEETSSYIAGMLDRGLGTSISIDEIRLVQGVITTKAMRLYSQNKASSVAEASQLAAKSFLDSQYRIIDRGGGGDSTVKKWFKGPGAQNSVIVPKYYQGRLLTDVEAGNIKGNLDYFLSPNGLATAGVVPPKGADDVAAKKFNEQVLRTGYYSTKSDGSGVYLWYMDASEATGVPALTGQADKKVKGRKKSVFIPMSRLIIKPSKPGTVNQEWMTRIPEAQ